MRVRGAMHVPATCVSSVGADGRGPKQGPLARPTMTVSMAPDITTRSALDRLPVDTSFERGRGAVDRCFIVGFADQHQAHRQAVDHAARQTHRRMVAAVEWCG